MVAERDGPVAVKMFASGHLHATCNIRQSEALSVASFPGAGKNKYLGMRLGNQLTKRGKSSQQPLHKYHNQT